MANRLYKFRIQNPFNGEEDAGIVHLSDGDGLGGVVDDLIAEFNDDQPPSERPSLTDYLLTLLPFTADLPDPAPLPVVAEAAEAISRAATIYLEEYAVNELNEASIKSAVLQVLIDNGIVKAEDVSALLDEFSEAALRKNEGAKLALDLLTLIVNDMRKGLLGGSYLFAAPTDIYLGEEEE